MAALLTDSSRWAGRVGDADGPGMLSFVLGARLVGGSDGIAVLDVAPPFLRVHRPDGALVSSAIGDGAGPQEMSMPASLGTNSRGDLIVAATMGELMIRDATSGALKKYGRRVSFPMAIVEGCDEGWLIYGPGKPTGDGQMVWLHKLLLRSDTSWTISTASAPETSIPGEARGIGGPVYSLVRQGDTVTWYHKYGPAPGVYQHRCGEMGMSTAILPAEADGGLMSEPDEDEQVRLADSNAPLPQGIAVTDAGMIVARSQSGGGESRTVFVLYDTAGDSTFVDLAGRYVIRDARRGELLLIQSDDPFPHLFMVRESDFLAALRR